MGGRYVILSLYQFTFAFGINETDSGVQIKNAIACANSLAWEDDEAPLAMRHIDTVLDALAEFSIASEGQ